MIFFFWSTLLIPDVFEMLQVGPSSLFCIFNGNLSDEYAVRQPSKRVAAIPDDVIANALLFCARMVASTIEIRNVFPELPGTFKKHIPPLLSFVTCIIALVQWPFLTI